jgi:glucosamine--fructose-6-phosphate aminotransferase (isomerizing)
VIDAVNLARKEGAVTAGFSDVQDSALARAAETLVAGSLGREPALPKTRSYGAALLRGYLLALELARLRGAAVDEFETGLLNSPALARQGLQTSESQVKELARQYAGVQRTVVVGGGPNWAAAMEASLKLTEAALVDSTPWEIEEAVHGTWASTKTGDLVIILAMKGNSYAKAVRLVEGMKGIDVDVWAITDSDEEIQGAKIVTRLPGSADELFQPLYTVLPLYQFAYFLALEKGIHPDIMRMDDPRYLQARTMLRSTVQ